MRDIYQEITDKIVAALESGTAPWHKPWKTTGAAVAGVPRRPIRHNGIPYAGINVLLLWSQQSACGYASNQWLTFKQALAYDACVRKGERGTMIVYADKFTRTRENATTGEDESYTVPFLKAYTVFNVCQIDGLPDRFLPAAPAPFEPGEEPARNARVDSFVDATGADIRHGGNRAFFAPSSDHVQMPTLAQFESAESYYATLLHEMTHWSGGRARLNRINFARWGDASYAAEELVAEMGAAFLCADLAVSASPRPDHASYIASWLEKLKNDKRAVFTAASAAQRAADYLTAYSAAADGKLAAD